MSRIRRCLAAKLSQARDDVAELTAAIAVEDDPSLRRVRDAAAAYVTEASAALRDYDDRHEDPDKTPVRSLSQQLRAAGGTSK